MRAIHHHANVGDRVGAFLSSHADQSLINILGYGVYLGDEVPPPEIGGFNCGSPSPKIMLDSGEVVWGCECWWGDEDRLRKWVGQFEQVVTVSVDRLRRETL